MYSQRSPIRCGSATVSNKTITKTSLYHRNSNRDTSNPISLISKRYFIANPATKHRSQLTNNTIFFTDYTVGKKRGRDEPLTDPLPSVSGPWKLLSSVSLADLRFHDRPIGLGV